LNSTRLICIFSFHSIVVIIKKKINYTRVVVPYVDLESLSFKVII
jgi:hypothetical protein